MTWKNGEPVRLAEPRICRRYHSPRDSPSIDSVANVATPSGKCPQMMTVFVHRLRARLAVRFAVIVVSHEGPDSSG